MPDLRARETNLLAQLDAIDTQLADREVYLKLASDVEGLLAEIRGNATTSTLEQRQHILRLLVKDVLIGPEKITVRHRIPSGNAPPPKTRNPATPTRRATIARVAHCVGGVVSPVLANLFMHYASMRGWSESSRACRSNATATTRSCTASVNAKPTG
jgi:hypothetical protein